MPPRNSSVEQRALRLIYDAGDEGLLQSELWKLLDVSSREGSRLAKKFEEKGRIVREKVLNDGRWTYKLFSKNEPVTLDSVRGCPCRGSPRSWRPNCSRGISDRPSTRPEKSRPAPSVRSPPSFMTVGLSIIF